MSEQKRGVVLETQKGIITLLTPQGEFVSIPWSQLPYPEVGSEISFIQPVAQKPVLRFNRLIAIAACLLVVLLSVSLWSGIFLPNSQQVVAYVNVDINPSIELGLNGHGKVVQATGLNQDGQLLLQNLKLEQVAADKAVELITQAAMANNYLQAGKENTVVITVSDPEKMPEKIKNLEQKVVAQLAAQQLSGTTQVIEISGEFHDKAKELGVSPGKYVILLEAVEEGLDLSVEDMKGNSIVKAIKMAGGVPGQIISRAQHDKNAYQELETRVADKLKNIEESRKIEGKGSEGVTKVRQEDQKIQGKDRNDTEDNINIRPKNSDAEKTKNQDEAGKKQDEQPDSPGYLTEQDKKEQDSETKVEKEPQEQGKPDDKEKEVRGLGKKRNLSVIFWQIFK